MGQVLVKPVKPHTEEPIGDEEWIGDSARSSDIPPPPPPPLTSPPSPAENFVRTDGDDGDPSCGTFHMGRSFLRWIKSHSICASTSSLLAAIAAVLGSLAAVGYIPKDPHALHWNEKCTKDGQCESEWCVNKTKEKDLSPFVDVVDDIFNMDNMVGKCGCSSFNGEGNFCPGKSKICLSGAFCVEKADILHWNDPCSTSRDMQCESKYCSRQTQRCACSGYNGEGNWCPGDLLCENIDSCVDPPTSLPTPSPTSQPTSQPTLTPTDVQAYYKILDRTFKECLTAAPDPKYQVKGEFRHVALRPCSGHDRQKWMLKEVPTDRDKKYFTIINKANKGCLSALRDRLPGRGKFDGTHGNAHTDVCKGEGNQLWQTYPVNKRKTYSAIQVFDSKGCLTTLTNLTESEYWGQYRNVYEYECINESHSQYWKLKLAN